MLLTRLKHRLVKMASIPLTDDVLYQHQVALLAKELTHKKTSTGQQRKIAAVTRQHPTLASGNSRTLILAHFTIGPWRYKLHFFGLRLESHVIDLAMI